MPYLIIAGLLLATALFEKANNGKGTRYLEIIAILILILFAGLRKNVGLDYDSYELLYSWLKDKTFSTGNIDYGWFVINRILPNFRFVLLITAILTVTIKWKAIKDLQNSTFVYTALFFYFTTFYMYYDMGIMRQGLAIGICYYSIKYIEQRSKLFFLCIAIAYLFHTTALIFLPLYFMGNKEYSRWFYYGLGGLALLMTILAEPISNIVFSVLKKYGGALISYRVNYYQTYSMGFNIRTLLFSFIRRALFLVLFVEMYKRNYVLSFGDKSILGTRKPSKYTWIYINGYFFSIAVMILFSVIGFGDLAGRMCASLYSLYIFLYVEIISDKNAKVISWPYYFIFVALAIVTMVNTVFRSEGYLPYMMGW